ncbi:chitin synthase 2 isoform X2 [Musca autumnalis]|uniref:chitin synthase 2 isoform X2 n=1 Tax=Musca autumnalis TaxID=221902 RepID=UPI003CF80671
MDADDDIIDENFTRNRKNKEKPPLWDSFQDPPSKKATGSAASWNKLGIILKLFKLFTYIFVFAIILVTAIASKISFVFMVAQVQPHRSVKYCNIVARNEDYVVNLPITEHIIWLWALIFAFAGPEVFTFFRSIRICVFKDVKSPTWPEVLLVVSFELLHVIGLAILTFYVFAHLDSTKALMLCSSVCFTPALLNVLIGTRKHWKSIAVYTISILALISQSTAFVVWPSVVDSIQVQILAIPLILVSMRWWENYINSYSSIGNLIKMVRRTKSRYHTYLYLSPLKIVLFGAIAFSIHGLPISQYFSMFTKAWNPHDIPVKRSGGKNALNGDAATDILESDKIAQLIVCATMWHETMDEMMEFLKSIVRLDEDQCARRMAKIHINNGKPDEGYYELETNIFFDDAFILDDKYVENPKNPPLNEYVKLLITSIDKAAFEVYGVNIKIKPPVKIETPYGGRLVWTLPGRTKMIAHLKNKDKIRHKKRWSQVMYMYYLLGFRIMELENVSAKRKAVIAENTFLLALDGDIDFQPQAVQLLIDRMKAIDELGAACGRIHPVGRGPMVWYQIFEYAIGHWLQKATEHVIGCVLCSPGCFSLFRGSALMENSVMKKYTTVSQEPMHYVQYDQGEDRWLCTLILKQGLRVEYSAASDAYTHSPEIFNEFYNQRRRWVPSTIANIFDLLSDAEMVVKNNSSISRPYIFYQAMLMVGTILGPGTIFLMMIGSFVTVFNTGIWTSFLWNFIPLLAFILSCIYLKQKYQLLLAFVISAVYCLVMMAVLIGIIIQMIDDGPLAPASLFFLLVFLQIFISGIMHPQEAGALVCGLIYYITIPSMYMLLLIYSVFNMNDVSWGTREVAPKKDDENAVGDDENKGNEYLPGWINDPLLVDSQLGEISLREKRFWKDLIKLYLKPMFHTKEKKAEIADSLRELRNMFAFAFVMINAIFVLIVFLLQLKKDYLHLEWPIDPEDFITYDADNSQIYIYRQYKHLDPIGFCFVIFFGIILIIQFIAMFFHRFATISQLLATTKLDWLRASSTITDEDAAQEIRGNAVHIARQLQRPKRLDDEDDDDSGGNCGSKSTEWDDDVENHMTRRSTVFKLHENRNKNQYDYSDLPRNFERRFLGDDDISVKHISMSRKSMMLLNETRFVAKRRLTQQTRRNTVLNRNLMQGFDNNGFENEINGQ